MPPSNAAVELLVENPTPVIRNAFIPDRGEGIRAGRREERRISFSVADFAATAVKIPIEAGQQTEVDNENLGYG